MHHICVCFVVVVALFFVCLFVCYLFCVFFFSQRRADESVASGFVNTVGFSVAYWRSVTFMICDVLSNDTAVFPLGS